jgi:hypothetical protein
MGTFGDLPPRHIDPHRFPRMAHFELTNGEPPMLMMLNTPGSPETRNGKPNHDS